MSDKPEHVSAKILEKEYTIACPPNEYDALYSAVKQVDTRMREIRSNGKIIGSERIAVMAAINLAHEMLKSKDAVESIDGDIINRLEMLNRSVNESLENFGDES